MQIETEYMVFVPLLVGLLAALKTSGNIYIVRWIPLLAIGAGLAIGFAIKQNNAQEAIYAGLLIGLSSIGTHSGIKNTFQKRNRQK